MNCETNRDEIHTQKSLGTPTIAVGHRTMTQRVGSDARIRNGTASSSSPILYGTTSLSPSEPMQQSSTSAQADGVGGWG